MTRGSSDAARLAAGLSATAAVSFVFARWLPAVNAATAAAMLLLVVVVVAATSRQWVAIATSIAAVLAFNVAFLPPVGTLTIADPQNWLALLAFLAVSLVASRLSALTRARTAEALGRRDELARLFDLSRDVLGISDGGDAIGTLARSVARRFDLDYVAIAVPRDGEWAQYDAGRALALPANEVASAFAAAQTTLEFDAYARTYAGHRIVRRCRHAGTAGAAARRHAADRRPGRRRPAGGSRHARYPGRRRGDRHRAGRAARRAQGRRADPPERAAQDGAAGVARP